MQTSLSPELIREFVLAGHGNFDKVKQMLAEQPALRDEAHVWGPDDTESAMQAAAHVGNAPIAEYLLEQGAPLDICTAAMLGRRDAVEAMLDADPAAVKAKGAHGIPLLAHAAFSGDQRLVALLVERGAQEGMSQALSHAVLVGADDLVAWILEHGEPDLTWRNYQGKTVLALAQERGNEESAALLREHGAME